MNISLQNNNDDEKEDEEEEHANTYLFHWMSLFLALALLTAWLINEPHSKISLESCANVC